LGSILNQITFVGDNYQNNC